MAISHLSASSSPDHLRTARAAARSAPKPAGQPREPASTRQQDQNRDGKVTPQETRQYTYDHPGTRAEPEAEAAPPAGSILSTYA